MYGLIRQTEIFGVLPELLRQLWLARAELEGPELPWEQYTQLADWGYLRKKKEHKPDLHVTNDRKKGRGLNVDDTSIHESTLVGTL